jgi:hypothetical protein
MAPVRRGSKISIAALAALLLVLGLAACGGGDSSNSTTAAAGGQTQSEAEPSGDSSSKAGRGEGQPSHGESGNENQSDGAGSEAAANFTPKKHDDSGGGSGQYQVKGGDNSIQEFGEEAGTPEFEAAAAALHNFLDARAEGNWAATCSYMSKAIVESFEKLAARAKQIEDKSCAGILEKLTNPAAEQSMKAEAEKADVGSLRIDGERSFVIYTGAEGAVFAMPMANEDGSWKVASLAGTPIS